MEVTVQVKILLDDIQAVSIGRLPHILKELFIHNLPADTLLSLGDLFPLLCYGDIFAYGIPSPIRQREVCAAGIADRPGGIGHKRSDYKHHNPCQLAPQQLFQLIPIQSAEIFHTVSSPNPSLTLSYALPIALRRQPSQHRTSRIAASAIYSNDPN